MRILHVTAGNIFGGIERTMATIALERELFPAIEREFVLCTRGRVADEFEATGAVVHYIRRPRARYPWSVIGARRDLRQILVDRNISALVTHAPWTYAMFGVVAKRLGIPLFLWLHAPLTRKHWLDWWASRQRPSGIVCNSRYTAASSTIVPRNVPLKVIYNPSRRHSERANHRSGVELRRHFGVRDRDFLIVQLGRIEPLKGHALLLEALRLLPEDLPWQAWIVGGPQSSRDVRLFAKLQADAATTSGGSRIRFLGQRDDIGAILSAANVLCQPNVRPESFGNSMVEALLAGVPVIATALGGAIEILEPDCGILTPPGDAAALARAISDLARNSDLQERLQNCGPARATELCDPERQIGGMCDFMTDVMRSA